MYVNKSASCCGGLPFDNCFEMLNAGPSELVVVSIMTLALLWFGNLTNLERQSAALFLTPHIHWNMIF